MLFLTKIYLLSIKNAAVKKKAMEGIISFAKISKSFGRESELKLVHSLIVMQMDLKNALVYGLPNSDLHSLNDFECRSENHCKHAEV